MLRSILILNQILGFIDFSYSLIPNGLLIRITDSLYYTIVEYTRMFILLLCTYIVLIRGNYYIQIFHIFKFWALIMLARSSETWIIKWDYMWLQYILYNIYIQILRVVIIIFELIIQFLFYFFIYSFSRVILYFLVWILQVIQWYHRIPSKTYSTLVVTFSSWAIDGQ